MPRRDWDPLADIAPPRYAYESDDEDETGLSGPTTAEVREAEVTFSSSPEESEMKTHQGGVMVIATGDVGVAWARGANLGEQVGQVNVNQHAVRSSSHFLLRHSKSS